MSRRPQSKSRESDWVRLQSRCVGWSAISSKSSWNHMPTISGMTERYSIFLRHQSDVLLTFGRLPALSSLVAASAWWRAPRNCTKHHWEPNSNSFTATAGSNEVSLSYFLHLAKRQDDSSSAASALLELLRAAAL